MSGAANSRFLSPNWGGFKEYLGPPWGIKDIADGSLTIAPRGGL